MKVLHLWKSESGLYGGGGAIAMARLHSGLKLMDVDSKILCARKTTDSPDIYTLQRTPRLERRLQRLTAKVGLNDIHLISSFKVKNLDIYKNADVLHVHGTHSGTLSYLALPGLSKRKPVVFTLHDMWAVTGHCGYSYDCLRWQTGCGKCPRLDAYPPVSRDATHIEWLLKKWVYQHSNLTVIAPSTWLVGLARQSLLRHFPIHHIPHGVDIEIFHPIDKKKSRKILGIPMDKKVLMCSAVRLDDYRKGGDLLKKIFNNMRESLKSKIVLLVMGEGGKIISDAVGVKTIDMGYIQDDYVKAACYSSADLFVFPTRAEAFGLVLIESIACGTPVISFKVGGVTDIIRNGVNGYLADEEDVGSVCSEIEKFLEDDSLLNKMQKKCRLIAEKEYSADLQNSRHLELYNHLVS